MCDICVFTILYRWVHVFEGCFAEISRLHFILWRTVASQNCYVKEEFDSGNNENNQKNSVYGIYC